jgi:hypothetical protein
VHGGDRGGRGVSFVGSRIDGCAYRSLPHFQPTSLLSSRDNDLPTPALQIVASPSSAKLWVHDRPIAYALLEGLAIHIISLFLSARLNSIVSVSVSDF